jgi:aerobic-type carbon monoxide dehydrogenase small subunit (CoxS/CutS family)
MTERLTLTVNGETHTVEVDDPGMPLLYALRDELGMNNPRFGCGLGQCGACTVHLDGVAMRSCLLPVSAVQHAKITTLAGLGTPEHPHPLQTAWLEGQVSQCAYCINGWIMTAAALLRENPHPSDAEIKTALQDLICRCGTHGAALRAIKRAAQETKATL